MKRASLDLLFLPKESKTINNWDADKMSNNSS